MIDPMSQNPVPPGAMPEEVRDDVPINASEGEYILSADVVRYIGLDKIQKMEGQAKEGIAQMGEQGRIGGEEAPMPAPMPEPTMEGPMFNAGGLVQKSDPQNPEFKNRGIPFAFSPAPYIPGSPVGTNAPSTMLKKYVGPDGRVLYIPLNSAGNPVIPIPEGYQDANEAPATTEQVRQDAGDAGDAGGSMWSDGLTSQQIREEQANRTFRTYDELNPNVNTGELGSIGGFFGNMAERVGEAFSNLTSGESMGALATLVGTFAGQPMLGRLAGLAIDKINEKREEEGLPKMAVEEIASEVSSVSPLSQAEITDIANNTTTSPSYTRTQSPANVQEEATQKEAVDLSQHMILGVLGDERAGYRAMIRDPEGKISYVEQGEEIEGTGAIFNGFKEDIDPMSATGLSLAEVADITGDLGTSTTPRDPFQASQQPLGRANIGFGTPSFSSPSPASTGRSMSVPNTGGSRGLSPSSPGVSFSSGDSGDFGGDSATGMDSGRTSSGGSVSGQAASRGYSQGESTVGRTGTGTGSVASSFSDTYGSVGSTGGNVGYSMGESVSSPSSSKNDFSGFDQSNSRGFSKGGLVNSQYKNYNIANGYSKGGLVKRKK